MEQSIRVSARGEFGQLQRGLHQLQGDLKNVVGEIDKGARKGGFFDDSQVRALDVFSRRFKDTLRDLDREFKKQNDVIDELARKMEKAAGSERDDIRKNIDARERELDVYRRQIAELEKLYDMQTKARTTLDPGGGTLPKTPGIVPPVVSPAKSVTAGFPFVPPATQTTGGAQRQLAQFTALARGLQQLRKDLGGVTSAVDAGARRGGIFDGKQVQALDFFKKRFEATMQSVEDEIDKQTSAMDDLYQAMKQASGSTQEELKKELDDREKVINKMHEEVALLKDIYNARKLEADSFGRDQPSELSDGGGSGGGGPVGGATSKLLGAGKFALGLAGLSSIAGLAREAYTAAYGRQVDSLDLAQRLRGQAGRNGSNTAMFDQASAVGRSDGMGYRDMESWQFLNQYTQAAGAINTDEQKALMKFGRSYGLSTSEVASGVSSDVALGGSTTPKEFADAIAGSVAKSGMTPRILEVMQTNNTLLQQMNTTLKDGSAKQILAYQTTLDKIGLQKGMTQLTGAQGANLIGGLGGIYTPGNDNWKWMGIRALQQYNPKKYGNMDLFSLESSFEDGLLNPDNIPAMAKYVKSISGGNDQLQKRILQKWLTDGGFAATKTEASDFYDATNGLTVFSEDQMKALQNGSIDSGAKYDTERAGETGQGYLDTEASFEHALQQMGDPIVQAIMTLKGDITDAATSVVNAIDSNDTLGNIYDFMQKNLTGLMLAAGGAVIATNVLKVVAALGVTSNLTGKGLTTFFGRFGITAAAAGAYYLANNDDKVDQAVGDTVEKGTELITGQTTAQADAQRAAMEDELKKNDPAAYEKYKQDIADRESGDLSKMSLIDRIPATIDKGLHDFVSWAVNGWTGGGSSGSSTPTSDLINSPLKTITPTPNLNKQTPVFKGMVDLNSLTKKDEGDSDIGIMPRNVQRSVTDFSEQGVSSLNAVQKSTKQAMDSFTTSTSGFKDYVGDLFQPVVTFFTNFGQQLQTAFGSSSGSQIDPATGMPMQSYNAANNSGITATQLNAKLGGKLSGMGAAFIQAGQDYNVDPALLAAIAMQETGNGTSNAVKTKNNVGGMMGSGGLMSFGSLTDGINAMASNLQRNYISQGLTSVDQIQKKYAPVGATNDPTNLNSNWSSGVKNFLSGFGIGGVKSSGTTSSFFNGWQKRVTAEFGQTDSVHTTPHHGLDIDGNQGDTLQALAAGKVSFINRDAANKTEGGNTVGIKMADGKTYFYAHMSKISDALQPGMAVNPGDYIGNVGGDPGKPGSGSHTTGSHLHLGYMDANQNLLDPEQLLKSLDMGDSTIGNMPSSYAAGTVQRSELTVTLKVDGEGAKELNKSTSNQLEYLVRKIMKEQKKMELSLSPTKAGY